MVPYFLQRKTPTPSKINTGRLKNTELIAEGMICNVINPQTTKITGTRATNIIETIFLGEASMRYASHAAVIIKIMIMK